ncbi:MAG: TetR family transcriptional regulator [Cellvibrionaceae bacterium]|nr:TetR family transcriptional regulator [Cellvibrionaceae bacterium]
MSVESGVRPVQRQSENKKRVGKIRKKNEQIIIAAAEIEFASCGYEGATIDNIARRAGVARTNINYYFDNKLKLYAAILSGILELWDYALDDLNPTDEPAIALSEYIRLKVEFSRSNPLASRIFAREVLSGAPRLNQYFDGSYEAWFNEKVAVFAAWAELGKMDPVNPSHLMFLIWSSTQHYADFETQVSSALGKTELEDQDYAMATKTLTHIVLKGTGCIS